jgi:LysR family hca operon transcriptional activator
MELRHLRYFIAVAEEGSLTLAAEKRLHTAQPSLSRQIRDLETEVGVQLMSRSVHGIELTAAGKAFSRPRPTGTGTGRCRGGSGAQGRAT